ncbi:MAG: dipeptide ABC transporter ATP-binding protein, partial [Alphaproteobacteria bacterium]
IVGESGSGKTMTALALTRLLPRRAVVTADEISIAGRDLSGVTDREFARDFCSDRVAIIFQDPMSSLNPVYSIGRQLIETMQMRRHATLEQARGRALFLLDRVGIPQAESRLNQFPHQLSGGQRQRVMIAMALMNAPELIIADEPTTALDVTVQAEILHLLNDLRREFGMTMILITHDLGVVSRTTDKIAVMYAGEIIEVGSCTQVLGNPRHPYTRGLLNCVPGLHVSDDRLGAIPGMVPSLVGYIAGCAFSNRCDHAIDACRVASPPVQVTDTGHLSRCIFSEIPMKTDLTAPPRAPADTQAYGDSEGSPSVLAAEDVSIAFQVRRGLFRSPHRLQAVDGVTLEIRRGETLALVGESGCGKSTLASLLLGQQPPHRGRILLNSEPIESIDPLKRAKMIQPIFQDPYSSLNPRRPIGEIIRRPLDIHGIGDPKARRHAVERTMEVVGLPKRLYHSYPSQISGGQRQRIAIARAIIMEPELVICDEPTSALDVSVQSQILNLLLDLRDQLGLTYLVITHDIGVVNNIADRVAVMYLGQIVEQGTKKQILSAPRHPYTQMLLESVLTLDSTAGLPARKQSGIAPNPLDMPTGCRFHPRCPQALSACAETPPPYRTSGGSDLRCVLD